MIVAGYRRCEKLEPTQIVPDSTDKTISAIREDQRKIRGNYICDRIHENIRNMYHPILLGSFTF